MLELLVMAGSWWIVGFSGAMMPGPVTTLVISETAKRGFVAGPLITLGHVLLEAAMVIALVFGIGDLLKQDLVAGMIGLVGGLFLMWMGAEMFRGARSGNVSINLSKDMQDPRSTMHPVLGGVLTSASSPYFLLWWATVGTASLISFRAFGIAGIAAFYFGHTLADWVWNNLLAFLVATGRRLMTDMIYRGILAVCGLFLLALSIYFVASGISFLTR